MFSDVKVSPSKGKGREESRWSSGWWDFYSLSERSQRPIVWSSSSTIFTAHPNQPIIIARLFSSSTHFHIPSPSPILSSPQSYQPPTLLSVSPNDNFLFAYYPGRDADGVGCLWKRGAQVDCWAVKDSWSFPRGAGAVAAEWAGPGREWGTSPDGRPFRYPPRGPPTLISSPTLLLVTQTQQLNVYYIRHYSSTLKVMTCPLTRPAIAVENSNSIHDSLNGPGGVKLCVDAAIGLGYNEPSILVAIRSCVIPSPSTQPSFSTIDLALPLDISQPLALPPESTSAIEWETWGEESTIELCEVRFTYDMIGMSLSTNPLPSIRHSASHLSNLSFVCTPPLAPDPSASPVVSPGKASRVGQTEVSDDTRAGQLYLAVTSLDFKDFTSLPKSELIIYTVSRDAPASTSSWSSWTSHLQTSRSFDSSVLAFLAPYEPPSSQWSFGLYVGLLETSGSISKTKAKSRDTPIGRVVVLKLPDLKEDDNCGSSLITSSMRDFGGDLPLSASVSPNSVLLCTVSSSLLAPQIQLHQLPRPRSTDVFRSHPGDLPFTIACAIQTRKSTADIAHCLSLHSVSLQQVVDILYDASGLIESVSNGTSSLRTWAFLGLLVDIYRAKARRAEKETDRDMLTARWRMAHDMCSIAACNLGFDDCKDEDGYDLEAVWQLVGLSSWVTSFVESLMKDCVLVNTDLEHLSSNGSGIEVESDDLFGPTTPSPTVQALSLEYSRLLHLLHPHALGNLQQVVTHVKRFRSYLGAMSARGENAQIAKDVLVDLVDYSGINFDSLQTMLSECVQDAQAVEAQDCRRSLVQCHPTPAMNPYLKRTVQKLTSSSIFDKPRLFVKPLDLVDGISRLSTSEQQNKEKHRDVVSKAQLLKRGPGLVCTRCGGKSEVGGDINIAGHISLRWRAWEAMWTARCVCGGLWASGST